MAPALPQLETVALRRGASNGGELRIELSRPDRLNAWNPQLARPDRLNAWNPQLAQDLRAALEAAATDAAVRAVTITGAGRAFSSGADLREDFDTTPDGHPDVGTALRRHYHPVVAAVRELPKPVLAAVNGPAAGIGCSLALACDLAVACESAYLLLPFTTLGLLPDGGATLLVPARAGLARAAEMALLGERVPARRALDWGLVTRVTPDAAFDAEVDDLAERLATGPTRAFAATKRALHAAAGAGLAAQLELEAASQQELAATSDFGEGVRAFREKRRASFSGE